MLSEGELPNCGLGWMETQFSKYSRLVCNSHNKKHDDDMLRLRQQAPMWPFWIEKTLLQDWQVLAPKACRIWNFKASKVWVGLKSGRPMAGFTPGPSETVKRRKCNVKVTEPILPDNVRWRRFNWSDYTLLNNKLEAVNNKKHLLLVKYL